MKKDISPLQASHLLLLCVISRIGVAARVAAPAFAVVSPVAPHTAAITHAVVACNIVLVVSAAAIRIFSGRVTLIPLPVILSSVVLPGWRLLCGCILCVGRIVYGTAQCHHYNDLAHSLRFVVIMYFGNISGYRLPPWKSFAWQKGCANASTIPARA